MTPPLDLIILGAGPAGLAARQTATECGMKLVLVDENPHTGGRIYKGIMSAYAMDKPLTDTYGPDGAWATTSITEAQTAPDVLTGHTVIDVTRTENGLWQVNVCAAASLKTLQSRRILVATGAKERPFVFPGWTLRGVMTAGAIQTLMKDSNCVPDCPVVVAGSGPLLLLLAAQLAEQGVTISALLETTPRANFFRAAPHVPGAAGVGSTVRQGLRLMRRIGRANVTHHRNVARIEAHGADHLSSVSFISRGGQQRLDCSLFITHLGIVPDTQLTRLLGCTHSWSALLQAWVPDADDEGQTSQDGISVAGDATGSNGAIAARNAGHLAALDAACKLRAISPEETRERAKPLRVHRRRLQRESRFLNHLFAPGASPWRTLPDATLLCRCEEVSFGTLREMIRAGVYDFDHLKAVTRCGMGPCQGRICADMAAIGLAEGAGVVPCKAQQMKVRPPLKPIPLKTIAEGVDIAEPLPNDGFVYTSEKT